MLCKSRTGRIYNNKLFASNHLKTSKNILRFSLSFPKMKICPTSFCIESPTFKDKLWKLIYRHIEWVTYVCALECQSNRPLYTPEGTIPSMRNYQQLPHVTFSFINKKEENNQKEKNIYGVSFFTDNYFIIFRHINIVRISELFETFLT